MPQKVTKTNPKQFYSLITWLGAPINSILSEFVPYFLNYHQGTLGKCLMVEVDCALGIL